MRDNLTRTLARWRRAFGEFTVGQKAVVIVGSGALLLAAFLVFRWVSTPSYAPLYTGLQGSDASAVIDELNKEGVQYKLADGGSTIEVPQNAVYSTRINMAGQGLPTNDGGQDGYSILDGESLSTSDFQEQTDYKRAMEGELDNTLEAMNGVQTAVVHLAMPQKQVFSDQQDPTTASVLLALDPGTTLTDEQVQAIVHLVSSSIDGLDAKNVTVTDSQGNLLSGDSDVTGLTSTESDAQQAFEDQQTAKVQALLDRIVGPGNATAQVTAALNFDQQTTKSTTYGKGKPVAGSQTSSSEVYKGPGAAGAASSSASGVVGPDGQMEPTTTSGTSADGSYTNKSKTSDNKVDQTDQTTVTAPGSVRNEHIMIALDSNNIGTVQPSQIGQMIKAGMGIDPKRGDSVSVDSFPFNRTAEQSAQSELQAAQAAQAKAQRTKLYRNIGIGAIVALMLLLAWLTARRRSKARAQATSYVVEQLRADAAARAAQMEVAAAPALAALESADDEQSETLRLELNKLVDDQPEDVAALLRGWLVERPR